MAKRTKEYTDEEVEDLLFRFAYALGITPLQIGRVIGHVCLKMLNETKAKDKQLDLPFGEN